MRALTPAAVHLDDRYPRLSPLPNIPPPTTGPDIAYVHQPSVSGGFQVSPSPSHRHFPAISSSLRTASSPRSPPRLTTDAVTFGYGALDYSDTDFHRAMCAPSRAH